MSVISLQKYSTNIISSTSWLVCDKTKKQKTEKHVSNIIKSTKSVKVDTSLRGIGYSDQTKTPVWHYATEYSILISNCYDVRLISHSDMLCLN